MPNAELRMPNLRSAPRFRANAACGSFSRRGHDCRKLISFLVQQFYPGIFGQLRFCYQFHPVAALVRFFLNNANFRDEFGGRTGFASRPIICTDRSSRPHQLLSEHASSSSAWQRLDNRDDIQRESFRALFKLIAHVRNVRLPFGIRSSEFGINPRRVRALSKVREACSCWQQTFRTSADGRLRQFCPSSRARFLPGSDSCR